MNNKKKSTSNCEECSYYNYDEEFEEYVCSINLDEDDYMRFLIGGTASCPYFNPYNEYKIVKKQN